MSCLGADSWQGAMNTMTQAINNREFIDAFTCLYANVGGDYRWSERSCGLPLRR